MKLDKLSQHQGYGIAFLRVVVGAVFFAHGWQKLFVYTLGGTAQSMADMGIPLPDVSAFMATFAELIGGAMLMIGAYTRLASLPLIATMLVAVFHVHLAGGFFLPNGVEYTLTLLAASAALTFTGAGALSVDAWLAGRRAEVDAPQAQGHVQNAHA